MIRMELKSMKMERKKAGGAGEGKGGGGRGGSCHVEPFHAEATKEVPSRDK